MAHREGGVIVSKISRNEGKLVMKYFKIKRKKTYEKKRNCLVTSSFFSYQITKKR